MREAMDGAHEFAIHGAISPVSILPWYIQFVCYLLNNSCLYDNLTGFVFLNSTFRFIKSFSKILLRDF